MYMYMNYCLFGCYITIDILCLSSSPPFPTPTYTHTHAHTPHTVSLDLLMADFRQITKGIKEATGELINNKQNTALKTFCLETEPKVTKLEKGLETAKVSSTYNIIWDERICQFRPNTV